MSCCLSLRTWACLKLGCPQIWWCVIIFPIQWLYSSPFHRTWNSLRPRSYDRRRRQTARCLRLLVKSPWSRPSNFQMTSMIRLLLKWWEPGLNAHCHVEKKSHFTGLLPSPKVLVGNFGTLTPLWLSFTSDKVEQPCVFVVIHILVAYKYLIISHYSLIVHG